MFIIKLLRYVQGYVRFAVTGGFTQRFFNLCARTGIRVWGIRPKSGYESEAQTSVTSYKRLRPIARKSGVKLRIRSKIGLPFIVYRYRRRWGLAAAAGLFVVMLWVMSGFIWSIEIMSSGGIPDEQIRAELNEIGIREGVWRGSINARESARQMMLLNDDIAWIALNIVGSTIHVEINPRVMPPDKIDDEKTPTNVVAARTGQIKYMEVYDGQKVLDVGDTVMEGEIIVSGITEDKWGNTMLKHARALVRAWTNESIEVSVPLEYDEKVYTGDVLVLRSINLFGFEVPLQIEEPPEHYDEQISRHNLRLLGRALPFTGIIREVRPYSYSRVKLSQSEARERAVSELKHLEQSRFGEAVIIERDAVGYIEEGVFIVRGEYVVERDIALVKEIFISE